MNCGFQELGVSDLTPDRPARNFAFVTCEKLIPCLNWTVCEFFGGVAILPIQGRMQIVSLFESNHVFEKRIEVSGAGSIRSDTG